MTCERCEYHKKRAQLWRHEAYKLAGHPLDWEPELVIRREWQPLTNDEIADIALDCYAENGSKFDDFKLARAIEAALKERNHDA